MSFKTTLLHCGALAGILAGVYTFSAATAAAAEAQPAVRVSSLRPAGAPLAMPRSAALIGPAFIKTLRAKAALRALAPSAATTLSYPYGIWVDHNGTTYVTNLFGGVTIYNSGHQYLGTITAGVNFPASVGTLFNGDVVIANNGSSNITIYNTNHALISTITDATLKSPTSLYVDPDDTIWCLDAQGTLHAYLSDGTVLPSTHSGGNVVGPWGPYVTVWGIADANGGYDETYENRAQAIQNGPSLFNDYVDGSPYAAGEAQDGYGQEYVSDLLHDQIQIWSANGAYQTGIINTPSEPYGVAVDPIRSRLYVVLTNTNTVMVYSTLAPYRQLGIIQ